MKTSRFFSTIYCQKHECFCLSSFWNSTDSCQNEGMSETSPFPEFQLSVEDDLLLSSPKAGVTVSITTLAALNRCLAAVGVPCEAAKWPPSSKLNSARLHLWSQPSWGCCAAEGTAGIRSASTGWDNSIGNSYCRRNMATWGRFVFSVCM